MVRTIALIAALMVSFGFRDMSGTPVQPQSRNILAVIDLSEQTMKVYRYGWPVHSWKVSTARRGYRTPTGSFQPYRMHKFWRSRTYDNAPMPFSVFFHKGFAIHGTNFVRRLGHPASHGCVRLKTANAKKFFDLINSHGGMKSARVVIRP